MVIKIIGETNTGFLNNYYTEKHRFFLCNKYFIYRHEHH